MTAMRCFGTITPSSNTVVERVTQQMARDADVLPLFARFSHAGTTDPFPDDYDWSAMLEAARLLSHARPGLICWNGTKGGLIGFDKDRALCAAITDACGIPALTSTLAIDDALRHRGLRRIGFVTPYVQGVNDRIARHWNAAGYDCAVLAGAGLTDNFSYSTLGAAAIMALVQQAMQASPEAIVFYCTNLYAAPLCAEVQRRFGIPAFDSVAEAVAGALRQLPTAHMPAKAPG